MSNPPASISPLPNPDMKKQTLVRAVAILGIVGILMGAILPAIM